MTSKSNVRKYALLLLSIAFPILLTAELDERSGEIAAKVFEIVEKEHLSKSIVPASPSTLRRFLDELDPAHTLFLAADIEEFERPYSNTNIGSVNRIYARYLQRMEERNSFIQGKSTWPASDDEARIRSTGRLEEEIRIEKLMGRSEIDAAEVVRERYKRLLERMQDLSREMLLQQYLNSFLKTYDPHSQYLTRSDLERMTKPHEISVDELGVSLTMDHGFPRVSDLSIDHPSFFIDQLQMGDRVAAIARKNGELEDVLHFPIKKTLALLRGKPGTEIRLWLIPAIAPEGTRKEIRLLRGKAAQELEPSTVTLMNGTGADPVALIRVSSFYIDLSEDKENHGVAAEVRRLLEKPEIRRSGGFILDLRKNQGGSLSEAVSFANLFLPPGPILQVKDATNRLETLRAKVQPLIPTKPLIVLVDGRSASAAEIVAAALQDQGRALIIGQKTFGKGTIQKFIDLGARFPSNSKLAREAGALKLTVQKFYRLNGQSIQNHGVKPDLEVSNTLAAGTPREADLEGSLPYDEVPAIEFRKMELPLNLDLDKPSSNHKTEDTTLEEAQRILSKWMNLSPK